MTTECYAMVRGSAVRVTGLGKKGRIPDTIQYAVSKAVAKVTINEVSESGSSELLGSDDTDNDKRVRLHRPEETILYTVDIDFVRVDPGVLNLLTGAPLAYKSLGGGFGKNEFGEIAFGGGEGGGTGTGFGGDDFGEVAFGDAGDGGDPDVEPAVVGFDAVTRREPVSFGLEVWSKLTGAACSSNSVVSGFDEMGYGDGPFGGAETQRKYGYTVFPHLRGGHLTGFKFDNGLVSFNVRGAQTRRAPLWNVGPYDLRGPWQRLLQPVSRNTLFRQTLTVATPPTEVCGIQETTDVVDGGTATVTTEDSIEGGTAAVTSEWIVEGGAA